MPDVTIFSTEELLAIIENALKARDFEAVTGALHLLAMRAPGKAQTIYDMITAVSEGDERKATLLAVLDG